MKESKDEKESIIKNLKDWVDLKIKKLRFFEENELILDSGRIMCILPGKQSKIPTGDYSDDDNIVFNFYSLTDFFKRADEVDGIGINAEIIFGDFGYNKRFFYYALRMVEDPEIGIPTKIYPLLIRNNNLSVYIAPKIKEKMLKLRDIVEIKDLDLVEELNLLGEDLKVIPEEIGQLKNLKKLNLAYNQISILPDSMKQLKSLEELVLNQTSLNKLPEWIGELKTLKTLNFRGTFLKFLPNSFKNLGNLETLNLEDVGFVNVNDTLELINADSLKALNLCKTGFTEILRLKRFKNLEELGIAGNNIKNINDLKYLKNLKELNISGNKYSKIEGIEDLIKLEKLDMDLYEIEGLQNLINLNSLIINYLDKDKALFDKLGGIFDLEHVEEVNDPQKIVEYCKKKRFNLTEFQRESDLGTLSKISVIVLEERAKNGDKKAKKLLNANKMRR